MTPYLPRYLLGNLIYRDSFHSFFFFFFLVFDLRTLCTGQTFDLQIWRHVGVFCPLSQVVYVVTPLVPTAPCRSLDALPMGNNSPYTLVLHVKLPIY